MSSAQDAMCVESISGIILQMLQMYAISTFKSQMLFNYVIAIITKLDISVTRTYLIKLLNHEIFCLLIRYYDSK